jgi:PAS domain S-box-containing protein
LNVIGSVVSHDKASRSSGGLLIGCGITLQYLPIVAMKTGRLQYFGFGLGTAAVYIASAKAGLTLAFVAEQVTVVWPPTGIALCAVLLFGYRIWPFIAAGAFIANITTDAPVITSLGITAGNTLEALAGAWLLTRLVRFRPSLDRLRDVFGLLLLGAGISTIVSATIGVVSLCITKLQPWDRFGSLWFVWYLGDAMGDVLVAPLVLTLVATASRRRIQSRGLAEFGLLAGLFSLVDIFIFTRSSYPPPVYAVFPLIIWSALRFGSGGAAIGNFITAVVAVLGTVQGLGPFTAGGTNENLIALHLFMSVAATTGLIMAVSQTEREDAVALVHRGEQRYKSLVLASSQVVWSTNGPGEVVEDLPTWRAFTGQTMEEMMGRGWMRMLHPDDIQRVGEVWERSLATRTPHEIEFRVMSIGGTYRNVLGRAVPLLAPDGDIREWVGALTDITDAKRAEKELQEANRRKDEFLAMLAHELRNPLAPVRNAVEIIRSPKADAATIAWACEVTERQVQHMSQLLDDLLDVARITHGNIQLSTQPADLTALVRRSLEASRIVLEKRQLRLETDFVSGPVPVSADVTRIEQVISNLISNAAKFTPGGGLVQVFVERDSDRAVLRVKDTGSGIAPELLPRIFDLFTQGDRSLARSEGGLGIGLTLVQNLVRMHGGSVTVKSGGADLGSEFTVRLPLLPISLPDRSLAGVRSAPAARSQRALVVEDNPDSAETLAAMIRIIGHEAHIALDGMTALAEFGRLNPSIVLLDIGLPGIDGYEVARRLRATQNGRPLRIIALTGYGSDADRERAKAAGFDHHLVKPVDFSVLEQLLNDAPLQYLDA